MKGVFRVIPTIISHSLTRICTCFSEKERDGVTSRVLRFTRKLEAHPSLVGGRKASMCLCCKWFETPNVSRFKILAEAARCNISTKWHYGFALFLFFSWLTIPSPFPQQYGVREERTIRLRCLCFAIEAADFTSMLYVLSFSTITFGIHPTCPAWK